VSAPEPQPEETNATIEPAIDENFPDPDVLEVDGTFFAYSTESNNRNVQVATSTDLLEWEILSADAFPVLPTWVIPGKTWAPEVTEVSPGNYVMYFTATNFQPAVQCVGVATATSPEGPFTAHGDAMLVCPVEEGGAIDATTVKDDDGLHLVFKNDGNSRGLDTWIQTAPLSDDGLALTGPVEKLLKQTEEWEGELVEAPTITQHDGTFVMLYSANSYGNDLYGMGLATAPALLGPWEKQGDGAWFSTQASDNRIMGPGGQDLVRTDDGDFLVFHGWDPSFTYRALYVAPVEWDGTTPRLVLD
jgi:beta-xylosidase